VTLKWLPFLTNQEAGKHGSLHDLGTDLLRMFSTHTKSSPIPIPICRSVQRYLFYEKIAAVSIIFPGKYNHIRNRKSAITTATTTDGRLLVIFLFAGYVLGVTFAR
jgi:hypothetical protein